MSEPAWKEAKDEIEVRLDQIDSLGKKIEESYQTIDEHKEKIRFLQEPTKNVIRKFVVSGARLGSVIRHP